MERFNLDNLNSLVNSGKIFSVDFTKRSTGKTRKMVCRTGVKKHLQNGKLNYSPVNHQLLTVFDMEVKGYRCIPIDTIKQLTVNGQTFTF